MVYALLIVLLYNSHTGEFENYAIKGYETIEACQEDLDKIQARPRVDEDHKVMALCVSHTDEKTRT